MIPFLLVIVLIIAVGAGLLAYRNRPEGSIESGITSFRREMRALAPPPEHRGSPDDGHAGPHDVPPRDIE